MSMIGGFFKKTNHQKFQYKPRFWDPDKEDLHQRVKAAQGAADNDPEAIKRRISNNLRRNYKSKTISSRANASKKSTILLLVIIGTLVFISYYLLTVYLPLIEESLIN